MLLPLSQMLWWHDEEEDNKEKRKSEYSAQQSLLETVSQGSPNPPLHISLCTPLHHFHCQYSRVHPAGLYRFGSKIRLINSFFFSLKSSGLLTELNAKTMFMTTLHSICCSQKSEGYELIPRLRREQWAFAYEKGRPITNCNEPMWKPLPKHSLEMPPPKNCIIQVCNFLQRAIEVKVGR